jgi:predicted amidohydrolase
MAGLRIALGQFGPQLGEVSGNLQRLRAMIGQASSAGATLVCFPELAVSGYLLEPGDYTQGLLDDVGTACDAIARDAARLGVDVVYGAPRRVAGELVNAVIRDRATGERVVYAKTHMDAKERRVFTRGDGFPVDPDGLVGLCCCYDIAFPEAVRAVVLAGARVVLVPMAWEVQRGYVMSRVVAARAIENVAYVVCINQCGAIGDLRFLGASRVVDPLGETVVQLGGDPELRLVDLDVDGLQELRAQRDTRTYPLLDDRRPELYGRLSAARPESGRTCY